MEAGGRGGGERWRKVTRHSRLSLRLPPLLTPPHAPGSRDLIPTPGQRALTQILIFIHFSLCFYYFFVCVFAFFFFFRFVCFGFLCMHFLLLFFVFAVSLLLIDFFVPIFILSFSSLLFLPNNTSFSSSSLFLFTSICLSTFLHIYLPVLPSSSSFLLFFSSSPSSSTFLYSSFTHSSSSLPPSSLYLLFFFFSLVTLS